MSYFTWTGNPWVDAGVSAMLAWSKKKEPIEITKADIAKISDDLEAIYLTDGWRSNLYSVFPNHPAIQSFGIKTKNLPQMERAANFKKLRKRQREEFCALLTRLGEGITQLEKEGECIACGRRSVQERPNRMHIPLTGYQGSHFFSHKADGVDYCHACTYAVQCSPLVLYRCGNKLVLVHSNSFKVLRYWADKCLNAVRKQVLKKDFVGCFDEGFKNPLNALFHITQDLINDYNELWAEENANIRIYYFTNYGQGADLAIYDLPARVFRFLAMVRKLPALSDWLQVVRKGYRYSIEEKEERDYKNYPNDVYQKLLTNESIVRYFLDYTNKRALGGWSLLSLYLKEVKTMDQKRIDLIRRVADDLAELIKTSANPKKELNRIESADNYGWFRNVLLRFMKKHVAAGDEKPLFTFEEYVEQLFPDGALGWKETQDLILFRIYEELHPWLLKEGIVAKPEEEEAEQSEN